jgi:hypothetical protein
MKANSLINSINQILNEDAYSKFTLSQLYTKLEAKEFFRYLQLTLFVVVRHSDFLTLKNIEVDHTMPDVVEMSKNKDKILATRYISVWKKNKDIILFRYERATGELDVIRARRNLETNALLATSYYNIRNKNNIAVELKKALLTTGVDIEKEIAGIPS